MKGKSAADYVFYSYILVKVNTNIVVYYHAMQCFECNKARLSTLLLMFYSIELLQKNVAK